MVTRISGMASGMDIDSLVKSLVTARKGPLDKLNQQKQILEWQREDYRKISTKIVTFMQDKLSELAKSATLNAQKTTMTGNTSVLTATASSTASGTFDIKVNQLATATQAASSFASKAATSGDPSIGSLGLTDNTITINGKTITVTDPANTKVSDLVTLINNDASAGVTALYDSVNGRLSLTNKETGAKEMTLTGGLADAFGLTSRTAPADLGKNASIEVNGLTMTDTKNQMNINGLTLNLTAVTPTGGASTRVEVSKDTEKAVKAVQDFVDAYNDVLSTVNSALNSERYKKYTPLSSEQKKEMTDDEIELWESKAKSGLLKNDSILQRTVSDMRSAMLQGVKLEGSTTPLTMMDLGITTGTYDTKGKLILDKDKLTTALDANPDILTQFLGTNYSNSTLSNTYTETDGILAKMRKISNTSLSSMYEKAGTSKVSSDLTSSFLNTSLMGQQLNTMERQITDWNSRLTRIETNYYKQFTAMETAINRYNSTMSSLSSM
ncbi:flagellar filament capping protein FliD [Saccharibacillus kuerlensis]|uniref:Flagellar hook-associated protein 2 n=1 Tax=Saccharibacillus kuerlensis TaxID=459527 RepID=A0ABQ2KTT5_9BACL|nr:flagellar filament capping protein FliD [Saccharibacillus kuerlensis]GGN93221.1 flagellar hook-associated protein 2 [Saccharibacillus kuerlensis]